MKQVILLMTNRSDVCIVDKIQQFLLIVSPSTDFYVLYNTEDHIPSSLQPYSERIYKFSSEILYTLGYMPLGDSLVYGNCHFALLDFYHTHPDYDYYWTIEDDVVFSGEWSTLFDYYSHDTTDMLSTHIKTHLEMPQWPWWHTLNTGSDNIIEENIVCAFNPIYRLSNRALQCVHGFLLNGWKGHAEVVISTILRHNGLSIKDIGGTGSFVPVGEENRFYTKDTHSHINLDVQARRPSTIYHPIKQKRSSRQLRKNCVISAVGQNSLHKHWLENGENRTFDLHLIVYDTSFAKYYPDADFLSSKKGFKLRLVYDYLKNHQEFLEQYSYFFIPDDDIMTDAQSIDQLFNVMEQYSLKIAQPALKQSYYTYPITLQKHFLTLRYTNFVEMMLPCFSREALRNVLDSFNENESGWGAEYHWPLLINTDKKDMAIIDSIPMVHTQPVKRGRTENEKELDTYLKKYQITPRIEEFGFVTGNTSSDAQATMNVLYEKWKNLVFVNMRIVPTLIEKQNLGEISRQGLDGKLSVVLYLKQLATLTEAVQYDKFADMLFRSMTDLKECSTTLNSFIYGELGSLWAAYLLKKDYRFIKIIKDTASNDLHKLEELENVLNCSIGELLDVPTSEIMTRISEYQLRKKSDVNILLRHCWQTMNELYNIETRIKELLNNTRYD